MNEVNNSTTKKIIDITIQRTKDVLKDDYVPREDLDFVDVFFPKLCAIYGTRICLAINEGKDISELLSKRGLSSSIFQRIEDMMKNGMDFSEKNKNDLSSIFEVETACNDMLKSYANRVREHLAKENKKIELEVLESQMDFFNISPNIYTPCSEYEKNKNNVK